MRFKINLHTDQPQNIPLNYQYPLSAWIYKVFNRADPQFAHWLHEHGYAFNGNRRFKLFTFSWLITPQAKMLRDKHVLRIIPEDNYFYVSFHIDEAADHFIKGLFKNQDMVIAGPDAIGRFTVSGVERIPDPEFKDGSTVFQCLSPVNVTQPVVTNGKLRAIYRNPDDAEYSELLHENLLRRYVAAHQNLIGMMDNGQGYEAVADLPFNTEDWRFELLDKPLKRGQKIKEGTSMETQVIGYSYRFRLSAPSELLCFAWNAGLGEKGSIGFGCVNKI